MKKWIITTPHEVFTSWLAKKKRMIVFLQPLSPTPIAGQYIMTGMFRKMAGLANINFYNAMQCNSTDLTPYE